MTASFVAAASYTAVSSLTTRTLNVPAGVADGDTILIFASKSGGTSSPTISGVTATNIADATLSGHAASAWIIENAAASLAGTTVTFTTATTARCSAAIVVMRGLQVVSLDTHTKTSGTSTTVTAPSAVAAAADVTLLFASTSANTASITYSTPSGFTKATEAIDTSAAGAAGLQIAYSVAGVASGATQGASTFTPSANTIYTAWTILLKVKAAADTVRPSSQISNAGSYTAVGGASLVAVTADESDSSYAETGDTPTTSTFELKLDEITSGLVTVAVRAQYAQSATSGTLVTKLMQGSTTISTWTDSLTGSLANYTHTTTSPEAATITDRTDLRVRCSITAA